MDKQSIIKNLKDIKKSILLGADGGITDTAWMVTDDQETIVERIDGMLEELGEDYDVLEEETREIIEIDPSYNGWKNYETWSVAKVISNDEGIYNELQKCKNVEDLQCLVAGIMLDENDNKLPKHLSLKIVDFEEIWHQCKNDFFENSSRGLTS